MEKIKQFIESEKGKDIMVVLIVILVGLSSFELGRLSKDKDFSGVKIEYLTQDSIQTTNHESTTDRSKALSPSETKPFFASSNGSKYYYIGCSGGKTIKQENKIYFTTKEEAERAGYELSTSCK
jgi:hypothetical protein